MKRALLAVCGLLLAAPALAGGRGHFSPHDIVTPPQAHEIGSFRNMFHREAPREIERMAPRDIVTPPQVNFRRDDIVTPPQVGFRRNDIVTPPQVGFRSNDIVTPPQAHTAEAELSNMRLVKPAWAE